MSRTAAILCATAVAAVAWFGPNLASAQPSISGAVTGHGLVTGDGYGGGLMVDLTTPLGDWRVGGVLGAGALTSDDDNASRVFMPLGLSLGLVLRSGDVWWELRGRGGVWGGATNDGLALGAFLSAGGYVGYALGPRVALGVGADGWFLSGHGGTLGVAPGITLSWIPFED